ncbi:glycosyltransferase [Jannaschia sp.]|nr:glycosyltransferase [Jannaschia sp.]
MSGSSLPAEACAIVVPSYRRPAKARACAESLMRLDGGAWPIIIVDDGSPEPLAPVLADLAPQVRVVRRANGGPGAARNTGAKAAEGRRCCYSPTMIAGPARTGRSGWSRPKATRRNA